MPAVDAEGASRIPYEDLSFGGWFNAGGAQTRYVYGSDSTSVGQVALHGKENWMCVVALVDGVDVRGNVQGFEGEAAKAEAMDLFERAYRESEDGGDE
jgi:hypothetical protein